MGGVMGEMIILVLPAPFLRPRLNRAVGDTEIIHVPRIWSLFPKREPNIARRKAYGAI